MNESAFFREKDEHTASSHYNEPVLSKKNKKYLNLGTVTYKDDVLKSPKEKSMVNLFSHL